MAPTVVPKYAVLPSDISNNLKDKNELYEKRMNQRILYEAYKKREINSARWTNCGSIKTSLDRMKIITVCSSHWRCSIKIMLLKISQYSQKALVLESLF